MSTPSRLRGIAALCIGVAVAGCHSSSEVPMEIGLPSDGTFVASDGVQLSYALDKPNGSGPFPAVVLVHGSGAVTKSSLLPLSQAFVAHGFAVLRYDKRGVGKSGGTYRGVSVGNSLDVIPQLASDAAAAVNHVRSFEGIDAARVGLAGGSQAGWIIPVAGTLAETKFAVILVGPTTSVGAEIFYSSLAENTSTPLTDVSRQLAAFNGPHGFDPLSYLRKSTTPTLWLYGADDRSVPTAECVAIHESLRRDVAPPFKVITYAGAGHGLTPAIWPDIYAWLDATVGR